MRLDFNCDGLAGQAGIADKRSRVFVEKPGFVDSVLNHAHIYNMIG